MFNCISASAIYLLMSQSTVPEPLSAGLITSVFGHFISLMIFRSLEVMLGLTILGLHT